MSSGILFIAVYIVFLIIGKGFRKNLNIASDIIVLTLIFTISFWGGAEIISGITLASTLILSIILSLLIFFITYVVGIFYKVDIRTKVKYSVGLQVKYILPLIVGIILGYIIRLNLPYYSIIDYELYILAAIIGFNLGKELNISSVLGSLRSALIPLLVSLIGSILAGLLIFAIFGFSPKLSMAISLGEGWYTYIGPAVASYYGPIYGLIAFLTNFFREQITFALVPLLLKYRNSPFSAIAVGGATTMDTTLGIYVSTLGKDMGLTAMINGIILTLIVPIIVPLILSL
ncbi:lysine exporter LysO family protein [Acidianus sp. DSM 29099]|nr:lysine exporter LysO family protein [Acidianus sp. RZ1]